MFDLSQLNFITNDLLNLNKRENKMAKKKKTKRCRLHRWQTIHSKQSIFSFYDEIVRRMKTKNGFIYQILLYDNDYPEGADEYPRLICSETVYVPN